MSGRSTQHLDCRARSSVTYVLNCCSQPPPLCWMLRGTRTHVSPFFRGKASTLLRARLSGAKTHTKDVMVTWEPRCVLGNKDLDKNKASWQTHGDRTGWQRCAITRCREQPRKTSLLLFFFCHCCVRRMREKMQFTCFRSQPCAVALVRFSGEQRV